MRPVFSLRYWLLLASALIAIAPAGAQQPRPNQLPPPGPSQAAPQAPAMAPIKPYKPLAITLPTPSTDASFEAFRNQLADVAKRKDRAGLAKLTVAQGFFWDTANGDKADKKKPAIANLEQVLGGLSGPDAQGWDALGQAASDPTLEAMPDRAGVMCGPAGPEIDEQGFQALTKATATEPGDWAFPVEPDLEVRSAAQPTAPVIEKLGMHLIRVIAEPQSGNAPPAFARIVTPSGKTGFVAMDGISPLGFDQLCYLKDASGWKITGFESAE